MDFLYSMQNFYERLKRENAGQCNIGEELGLLEGILVKCVQDLGFSHL